MFVIPILIGVAFIFTLIGLYVYFNDLGDKK